MPQSTVVYKSLNPLAWKTWVFGWHLIRALRYKLADRVNARSGRLARSIRWPLGLGSPDRWSEVHVFRIGGIGDSLMSTPALRQLKQLRPHIRIVFYTPYVEAFRDLPFLDEVRPIEDCSHPTAVLSLNKRRRIRHVYVLCGYRDGVVELLYEGSIPPRRHIARIFGDQLGLDVDDVRPSCVFDEALIRQYQQAWAHLPRPWVVVNRKSNNSPNKDWMDEHWDRLITRLVSPYTIIEIGAGRQRGDPVRHPHYVDLTGRLPLSNFLAAVAAGDIHVGPDSGPVHVAAAAGKPSVVIYGGYIHPDCVGYPGNIDLYTALPCSPCWLLLEPCPYDRVCLRRISPERVEEAIASLARAAAFQAHGPLEQVR
jgi:ADP-heptose:LPS heptosyltransferase